MFLFRSLRQAVCFRPSFRSRLSECTNLIGIKLNHGHTQT